MCSFLFVCSKKRNNGIDYMGFRAWIGIWTAIILTLIVLFDCSALVKFITRFTGDFLFIFKYLWIGQ